MTGSGVVSHAGPAGPARPAGAPGPACPACHAPAAGAALQSFSASAAAQHFVLMEEYPLEHARLVQHIEALWGGSECQLRACATCGLQFAWPFVAGDGDFYNLAYPYSAYPSERWEFDQSVAAFAREAPSGGKVLEIGSGFGHFLTQISPRLVAREQVVAIEYNDLARARIAALGFTAYGVDVRSPELLPYRGQLAAVFMFQVLEHLDGLDSLFERLRLLLRPGASVFVAVPNVDRLTFNEAHGSLLDMPPNHISRWAEPAFRALGSRLGWRILAYRVQPLTWPQFLKQDLVYAHMRRSQRSGSLANRVRARRRSRHRLALEALLAVAAAPARMPAWLAAVKEQAALGDSVWVHFKAPG